ncbi:S-adenosyl-L-methionine-dependent methyltransferase [Mycena venus]|uniref:S-adenosyl-L-methionine-dependent methyltransferase n=1 Tax=Mycena venus TaxID=2733690 RepID=A0A8H7CRK2_9AGAR|nr:S-adenosyl-L-methionine-dependent methyltransferase [Mycena venus]
MDNERYLLTIAYESDEETQRLDEMHAAFTCYFGGKLSQAQITDVHPRKILDLGCGSGAWAIQAAVQFPEAQVIAVDISALPKRQIPENLRFQLGDITNLQSSDFEEESFDIVHSRLVMTHVPNGEEAVKRAAQLVKPGGLLLMEDLDLGSLVSTGGPAVRRLALRIIEIWESRSVDAELGRKLAGIMASVESFPQVHVHKIAMPFAGTGSDEATNELGLAVKKSWIQASEGLGGRLSTQGITEVMEKEQSEELGRGGLHCLDGHVFLLGATQVGRDPSLTFVCILGCLEKGTPVITTADFFFVVGI